MALWSPAIASAQNRDAGDTVVMLTPGWNLVGWGGGSTPVLEATASISHRFLDLRVFERESESFLRFHDGAPDDRNTLHEIPFGAGVWVLVDEAIDWTQGPSAASTSVGLEPGPNLVAWLGADETSIADALAPLGDALVSAQVWDPDAVAFRTHRLGLPAYVNDEITLSRGDGLWVRVRRPVDWVQTLPEEDAVSATVEVSGAVVVHPDGASVEIDAGALPVGAQVQLYRVPLPANLPENLELFGDRFEVSASARLDGFATLRLPIPAVPPGSSADDLVVFRLGSDGVVQDIGGVVEDGSLVTRTSGFSELQVGKRQIAVRIIGPDRVLSPDDFTTRRAQYIAESDLERPSPGLGARDLRYVFSFEGGIFHSRRTTSPFPAVTVGVSQTPGRGVVRVEVRGDGVSGSAELAVESVGVGFHVDGFAQGRVEPLRARVQVGLNGGTPPYQVRLEWQDGVVQSSEFVTASLVFFERYFEDFGFQRFTLTATDSSSPPQMASDPGGVLVAPPLLRLTVVGPTALAIGEEGVYDVFIEGGVPGYSVVATAARIFPPVGSEVPDPSEGPVSVSGNDGFAVVRFAPQDGGSYVLRILVEDALGAIRDELVQLRVPELRVSIPSSPALLRVGEEGEIAVAIQGGSSPYEVEVFDDVADFSEFLVVDERDFTLPITFSKEGPHELSVVVKNGSDRAQATVLIDVRPEVAVEAPTWVLVREERNPSGDPFRTFDPNPASEGSFFQCSLGAGTLSARHYSQRSDGTVRSDFGWDFSFDRPPDTLVPGGKAQPLSLTAKIDGIYKEGGTTVASIGYWFGRPPSGAPNGFPVALNGFALVPGSEAPREAEVEAFVRGPSFGSAGSEFVLSLTRGGIVPPACTLVWTYVWVEPQ